MTDYYNEIDPAAAQWLRNLIDAGHIAPGYVDERSIEDVYPSDLRGFTQCHFFSGIGVWAYALRKAGWPSDRPVWTGSCPCQPFSAAGKGVGFNDERHLWPAFHHLIKECKPATVIGEQVASKDADSWIDLVQTDMEAMGYAFGAIPYPSASVGAPHIRDRLYWVGHADNKGLERRLHVRQRSNQRATWQTGVASGLANNQQHDSGRQAQSSDHEKQKTDRSADWIGGRSSAFGGLANDDSNGCKSGGEGREAAGHRQTIGADCGTCGMDNAISIGRGSRRDDYAKYDGKQSDAACNTDRPSPTNGFWRDADWLGCRDGKWRPVEPGTFPLVNGATSRVVKLRAYGNAINAIQAQTFIESVMEIAA